MYSCVPDTLSCLCSVCTFRPLIVSSHIDHLRLQRVRIVSDWTTWELEPGVMMEQTASAGDDRRGLAEKSICDMHRRGQPIRTGAKVSPSSGCSDGTAVFHWTSGIQTNIICGRRCSCFMVVRPHRTGDVTENHFLVLLTSEDTLGQFSQRLTPDWFSSSSGLTQLKTSRWINVLIPGFGFSSTVVNS